MATWRLGICLLVVGCTDPHARPVPPLVEVQFPPSFVLTSPGQLLGAVHLYDQDGLRRLRLSVFTADSAFAGDSTLFLSGDAELTRPINWVIPAGLTPGLRLTVVARVDDFAGFTTTDSVKLNIANGP